MKKIAVALLALLIFVSFQSITVKSVGAIPQYMLIGYSTCKNVKFATSEPIGLTDEFSRNDSNVYAWFMVGYTLPTNASYTWKWFDPSGRLYQETSRNDSGNGPRSIYGEPLEIQKIPLQERIGLWRVEVYIDGDVLFKQNFTIGKYIVVIGVKGLPKNLKTIVTLDKNQSEIQGLTERVLQFDEGTNHTFAFERVVNEDEGTRYVNASFTGPFEVSRRRLVTVVYVPQYYLKVDSAFGNPQGSGWYDMGVNANFSVSSPVYDYVAAKHTLSGWTGDYVGAEPTGTIEMDGPRTIDVVWQSDYTLTYVLVVVVLLIVVILVGLKLRKRRNEGDQLPKSSA